MTHPFCVEHHVDIRFDTLVVYIKIDVKKIVLTFELPPLHITIENGSQQHVIGFLIG
jgi:hypothetical protein